MIRIHEIAAAVRSGAVRATDVVERCLAELAAAQPTLIAVTRLLAERARAEAAAVDAAVARGAVVGPLAGVPYGVKDLFDVAGLPTTAGSALYADAPPAVQDAAVVRRLRDAGAVLVATLNMDAFAYGFATINAVHGTTRNPHDPTRLAGGSSGGSAAVVAAGLLPFSLGSDTNGSVRVPASLTGIYGLKPTHGALPDSGMFPFAASFDDVGPFATSARDMALLWHVLSGRDDVADGAVPRVGRLGGRFAENLDPAQAAAIAAVAPDAPVIVLDDVASARSAAFVITAFEGGRLHAPMLARDAMAFDPATRDRLLAGALVPAAIHAEAQAFRVRFVTQVMAVFEHVDVLIAPAAPCVAPTVADPFIMIDGQRVAARADLGIHTQPITLTGLPSLAVPLRRPGALPLGLQLIGPPGSEARLIAYAATLEAAGWIAGPRPLHRSPVARVAA